MFHWIAFGAIHDFHIQTHTYMLALPTTHVHKNSKVRASIKNYTVMTIYGVCQNDAKKSLQVCEGLYTYICIVYINVGTYLAKVPEIEIERKEVR